VAPLASLYVIQYLNAYPDHPTAKRVAAFVDLCQEAGRLTDDLGFFLENQETLKNLEGFARRVRSQPFYCTGVAFDDPEIEKCNRQLNRALTALYECAAGYTYRPVVRPSPFGPDHLSVAYEADGLDETAKLNHETRGKLAFTWILDNIEFIHRFRRCRQCRNWFFAATEHQKFCDEACRKRHASYSADFKDKRRRYMRKYRRDEKRRDKLAKKLARGSSGPKSPGSRITR
jgi:hypothetical protein